MMSDLQAMRDKVAQALYARHPYYLKGGDVCPWGKLASYERESRLLDADATIAATIQALIELELPLAAIEAAEEAQMYGLPNQERTFIAEVDGFRAILGVLLPLLTNGAK